MTLNDGCFFFFFFFSLGSASGVMGLYENIDYWFSLKTLFLGRKCIRKADILWFGFVLLCCRLYVIMHTLERI